MTRDERLLPSSPERSVLASLAPDGLGTPMAISNTGYLHRLADVHRLAPVTMLRLVIAETIGRPNVVGLDNGAWARYFGGYIRNAPASLNGVGTTGETWAAGLSAATLRDEVRRLPMTCWRNVLGPQHMLVGERRYCPVHLEEWRVSGQPVYEPLLWQFPSLSACAEHRIPLEQACPSCGRTRRVLASYGRPGFCHDSSCEAWLGRTTGQTPELSGDDLSWATFASRELGDLVAVNGSLTVAIPAGAQVPSVLAAVEVAGSMSALADRAGFSVSDVSLWGAGRRRPSLDAVLRVCRASGFSLVAFLRGDVARLAQEPPAPDQRPPRRATHRRIDWPDVSRQLTEAAELQAPPSLESLALQLALDPRQIRAAAPGAYGLLRDRHAHWRREKAAARRQRYERVLDDTIRQLVSEGVYPSKHQVTKRAGSRLPSMRNRALHAQWRATLMAMGIKLRRHPFGPQT